mmetsp:Transcript_14524/g.27734  ORF Transcript_14524/g.27734 Transcript_14524/m.27734 type:complete len:325 (-) Transcript_14524:1194-2168(-)
MVEGGVPEVDGAERVGESAHEKLLEFQLSREGEAQVGRQREVGGEPKELLLVILEEGVAVLVRGLGSGRGGDGGADAARDGIREVGQAVADDLVELRREHSHSLLLLALGRLEALHEIDHVRVAPRQSLADDLKGPSHDVGPLHGDGDGQAHVRVAQIIPITSADGAPGRHVHASLHHPSTQFGALLLHDARYDHGRLVVVNDGVHEIDTGDGRQRVGPGQRHRLLDAAELGDGDAELLPHPCVRAGGGRHGPGRSDRASGEGNAPALREALDEHVPPEAAPVLTAEDGAHGYPDVLALHGAVHEGGVEGHVTRAHAQAGMIAL